MVKCYIDPYGACWWSEVAQWTSGDMHAAGCPQSRWGFIELLRLLSGGFCSGPDLCPWLCYWPRSVPDIMLMTLVLPRVCVLYVYVVISRSSMKEFVVYCQIKYDNQQYSKLFEQSKAGWCVQIWFAGGCWHDTTWHIHFLQPTLLSYAILSLSCLQLWHSTCIQYVSVRACPACASPHWAASPAAVLLPRRTYPSVNPHQIRSTHAPHPPRARWHRLYGDIDLE